MATTWTHIAARAVVTPLIGTGVTPNHLTTLRLLTGLSACVAVALGTPAGNVWGALLWLLSCFLDRADGELARVGNMMSEKGHAYDYASDAVINALIFFAAGIGARHSWLGVSAIALGALATAAMGVCWVCGEIYQKLENSGQKAYAGKWGFDLDDGLYLLAPFIGFGLMSFVVLGGAIGTSVMAVVILVRLRLLRTRLRKAKAGA